MTYVLLFPESGLESFYSKRKIVRRITTCSISNSLIINANFIHLSKNPDSLSRPTIFDYLIKSKTSGNLFLNDDSQYLRHLYQGTRGNLKLISLRNLKNLNYYDLS